MKAMPESSGDWKEDLDRFLRQRATNTASEEKVAEQKKLEGKIFLTSKVLPAFAELKVQLEKNGRMVTIYSGLDNVNIIVKNAGLEEFNYSIEVSPLRAAPQTVEIITDRRTGKKLNARGTLRSRNPDYSVSSITKEEIIQEALRKYKDRV
jgi:hypothetical protein